ncbi:MAG: NAD(P)/FAD-dependent oxidoreductase [Nocardioides sp.]
MSTTSGPSLWLDQIAATTRGRRRPPLVGEIDADVAIVGAGFTGLWTAYYLLAADPGLKVVVLEAEHVGFGASGRNGGWASALFPKSLDNLARVSDRGAALALDAEMRSSVREIERVALAEGIKADVRRGGTIVLARSAPQRARAQAEVRGAHEWGLGPDQLAWLDSDQARARLNATEVRGATYTPDCAAIQPAKLAIGLADAVEGKGGSIFEDSRVTSISPGVAATDRGSVRARHLIRATEGYTSTLPGHEQAMIPVYSMIVATEPLADAVWEQIGLHERETFSDHRHLIIYGQRTADNRMVFGGRGAPYHFGSRLRPGFDRDQRVFARLYHTLIELFPVLTGTRVTHAWGGPLGIARDWWASVGMDERTGLGWAGGYVGDGVTTTNLAGRTLRDLILGNDTALTRLPWVNHRSPLWEPEPQRWLLINGGLRAVSLADAEEQLTGRPSLVATIVKPFIS